MDIIELETSGSYTPANGASYPNNSFGNALQVVAQMVKLDLGLRVAAVDLGGWDTHSGQGGGNPDAPGYFIEWLVQRVRCQAIPLRGRWYDIGSLETLDEARRSMDAQAAKPSNGPTRRMET